VNTGTWSDISNTASTYNEAPTSIGTWEYRAEVQSGVCSSLFSGISSIQVSDVPDSAGTINGLTSVCQGQSSVTYSVPSIANANIVHLDVTWWRNWYKHDK